MRGSKGLLGVGVVAALVGSALFAVPALSAASSPSAKKAVKCHLQGETGIGSFSQDGSMTMDLTAAAGAYNCTATITGVWKGGAHLTDVKWKAGKTSPGSSKGTFKMPFTSKQFNGTLAGAVVTATGDPVPVGIQNGPESHPQCWWYINNVHNPPIIRYICAWTVYVVITD